MRPTHRVRAVEGCWRGDWRVFWYVGGSVRAATVSHGRGDAGGSLLGPLGARGRRSRDPHRGAHPRCRQRSARAGSAAGVPHRVDRRAVRPERGGGLVAAAGQPARSADDAHRLRHGADPDAVVEPAAGAQRRQLLRHAAGGALPSRLPGLPERPGPGPGRAGPRRCHVCRHARSAAGQDPARLQPRQPVHPGRGAGRRHGGRAASSSPSWLAAWSSGRGCCTGAGRAASGYADVRRRWSSTRSASRW